MSAAGQEFRIDSALPYRNSRSPLAHLLHALNQPLTGLQCSLELALTSPRSVEQYTRTLREGLGLTERMRMLSEAMRTLTEEGLDQVEAADQILMYSMLRDTIAELQPIAEIKGVQILLQGTEATPIQGNRHNLGTLSFRLLESALSLAAANSVLHVAMSENRADDRRQILLEICWHIVSEMPMYSPFSPPELGLLLAQAGAKRVGADWREERSDGGHTISIRLPCLPN